MARDLNDLHVDPIDRTSAVRRRRIDRATAHALAAALSALAVATVVVGASSAALVQEGTNVSSEIETGTITLADDDGGRSLVELTAMAPGRPVTECIRVAYTGTVLPAGVDLIAETSGDIAEYVHVEIERGSNGGFGDCDRFVPEAIVFDDRLVELTKRPVDLGLVLSADAAMVFRVQFALRNEAAAAGRSGTVDFVWEAVPA